MRLFLLTIIFIFFSVKSFAHGTIIVRGVEHEDGFINVKIYTSKESFLKEDQAAESAIKKPKKSETIIPINKIHEGQIAIVIFHDEDGNGKLKTGLFWSPKEGFAFSNGYSPKGPPKFSKASIDLIHGEPVIIELNY